MISLTRQIVNLFPRQNTSCYRLWSASLPRWGGSSLRRPPGTAFARGRRNSG